MPKLSELTIEQMSRWIAEKEGNGKPLCDRIGGCLKNINPQWDCKCDDWQPRLITEPEIAMRLLKSLMYDNIKNGHCLSMNDGFFSIDGRPATRPEFVEREIAQAYMLANGWKETQ